MANRPMRRGLRGRTGDGPRHFSTASARLRASELPVVQVRFETGEPEPRLISQDVSLQPPVPVMRVSSAMEARKFYVDFLGFAVDWGWSENNQRPLYAQVSRSGVTLHLSEHHIVNGATELLIRVTGLAALQEELSLKAHPYALRFRQTQDDRREIQITDPFGNLLRFSENNPPGTANE